MIWLIVLLVVVLLLVLAALALTVVLSTRAVTTAFRPLVEPPWASRLLGRDLTAS